MRFSVTVGRPNHRKKILMAQLPEEVKESLLLGIAIVEATVVDQEDMLDAIGASYTSEEREAALLATIHVAIGTIQRLAGEEDPTAILNTFRNNLLKNQTLDLSFMPRYS